MTSPDGEHESRHALRKIVPWVVSIGLHAGLVGMGFLITWTVVSLVDDDDPVLVTAEFDALNYDPLSSLDVEPMPEVDPTDPSRIPVESLQEELREQLAALDEPSISLDLPGAATGIADFLAGATANSATFVGMSTTNARRIVYVIDASGSMMGSLQIVIRELARSLDTLSPQQEFAVIFFQRNQAVMVPPARRMTAATPEARTRALAWIADHVIPAGRSNPLAALEQGIGLGPDVIFLLSENITGSGEFEIDQADLLALLEQLNPVDRATGRRSTRINCVQFLDPDPLQTLRRIAEQHGGADGFRFLSRAELGL